jgi:hypothetical protein
MWGILRAIARVGRGLKGIEGQLERIADALGSPNPKRAGASSEGGSWVSYTSDEEEARREAVRTSYEQRTGVRLRDGEAPPGITDGNVQGEEEEIDWARP